MAFSIGVIFVFFGMSLFNEMNFCYQYGCSYSAFNIMQNYVGTGHPLVTGSITPLINPTKLISVEQGNSTGVVDSTDINQMNQTLTGMVAYSSPGSGITDWLGFFGYVLPAARLLINTFFMGLFGLPGFLVTALFFPIPIAYIIGAGMFILQIFGIIEFITGRNIV